MSLHQHGNSNTQGTLKSTLESKRAVGGHFYFALNDLATRPKQAAVTQHRRAQRSPRRYVLCSYRRSPLGKAGPGRDVMHKERKKRNGCPKLDNGTAVAISYQPKTRAPEQVNYILILCNWELMNLYLRPCPWSRHPQQQPANNAEKTQPTPRGFRYSDIRLQRAVELHAVEVRRRCS